MGWNPFKSRSKEVAVIVPVEEVPAEDRSVNIPEKVYISNDGIPSNSLTREYSFTDPVIMQDILFGAYSDYNMLQLFYAIPEIAAPVLQIATRVADATWLLKKESNDEIDYKNAQFNKLFTQPNPLQNIQQMICQQVIYELLTGKSFAYVNIPYSLPWEFNNIMTWGNLPTPRTEIDVDDTVDIYTATDIKDFVKRYWVCSNWWSRRGAKEFLPDRVLPFINLSLYEGNDIRCAKSILLGAQAAIVNLILVYSARKKIYLDRGALGFLVSRKSDEGGTVALTEPEKREAIRDFNATYGITGNRSPIGITSLPLEFIRTTMSIQELQPFDETLQDAMSIYSVLQVPGHLVPSKDRSTFNNANNDMVEFYQGNIVPRANSKAQAFTSFFRLSGTKDVRNGRYICAAFPNVKYLQENRKEESETAKNNGGTYLQRFQNGACTLNDWRVANGDERIADSLYNKTILQMTDEELSKVKNALNLKTNVSQTITSEGTGSEASQQGGGAA